MNAEECGCDLKCLDAEYEYIVFGSQIQKNRKKIFFGLFSGKNKNFAKY